MVTQTKATICCLLILFVTQSGSCTFWPPRLLSCFPLHRWQISSDITSSPLSSTTTKTETSKGPARRLNKLACVSAKRGRNLRKITRCYGRLDYPYVPPHHMSLLRLLAQAGSSIYIVPIILSIQCPRRFFGDKPWNLAHVFYEPLPANPVPNIDLVYVHIYVRQICFCIFLGYLGVNSSTAWQGPILVEHICKQSGSMSKKQRGHWEFCAENMCNLRSFLAIT